jgi:hypothetical protein
MTVPRVMAFVGLAGLLAWAGWMGVAPSPVSPRGAGDFSVEEALGHVRAMAEQGPHPAGSETNRRVREHLIDQLTRLGMEPRVLEGRAHSKKLDREAPVRNILARLRGTEGGTGVFVPAP